MKRMKNILIVVLLLLLPVLSPAQAPADMPLRDSLSGWRAGVRLGLPFLNGTLTSFSADGMYWGMSGGLEGSYWFNPAFGAGMSVDFGGSRVGSRGYARDYGVLSDGRLQYYVPDNTGMLRLGDIYSKVSFLSIGLAAHADVLRLYRTAREHNRWGVVLSPGLYIDRFGSKLRDKGNDALYRHSSTWSIGMGGDVQVVYRLDEYIDLYVRTGGHWFTANNFSGVKPALHLRSNGLFSFGIGASWRFGNLRIRSVSASADGLLAAEQRWLYEEELRRIAIPDAQRKTERLRHDGADTLRRDDLACQERLREEESTRLQEEMRRLKAENERLLQEAESKRLQQQKTEELRLLQEAEAARIKFRTDEERRLRELRVSQESEALLRQTAESKLQQQKAEKLRLQLTEPVQQQPGSADTIREKIQSRAEVAQSVQTRRAVEIASSPASGLQALQNLSVLPSGRQYEADTVTFYFKPGGDDFISDYMDNGGAFRWLDNLIDKSRAGISQGRIHLRVEGTCTSCTRENLYRRSLYVKSFLILHSKVQEKHFITRYSPGGRVDIMRVIIDRK